MHHIVMQICETRIVARFAEARVIRSDHAESIGPGFGEIKTVHRAGAMEEDKRLAPAGRVHHRLYAIDDEFFPHEPAHRSSPFEAVAARESRRGITSSARRVMFFTAFQCGMSATCMTLFM